MERLRGERTQYSWCCAREAGRDRKGQGRLGEGTRFEGFEKGIKREGFAAVCRDGDNESYCLSTL
jgi:hypothetical protein